VGKVVRKVNDTFLFAVWWFELLGREVDASDAEFRTLLGKASKLRKEGYDLRLVKRAILTMRAQGIDVTSPYAVRWSSPNRKENWYEYSRPSIAPVWDGLLTTLEQENLVPLRAS